MDFGGELLLFLVANSLWIMGAALLLAAFSYHYYEAQRGAVSLRLQLQQPSFLTATWTAMTLVALGLLGTSTRWWEAAIWAILGLASAANAVVYWRAYRAGQRQGIERE